MNENIKKAHEIAKGCDENPIKSVCEKRWVSLDWLKTQLKIRKLKSKDLGWNMAYDNILYLLDGKEIYD